MMKKLWKPTLVLILFVAMQSLGGVASIFFQGRPSVTAMIVTVTLTGLLTVVSIYALRMVSLRSAFSPGPIRWPQAMLAVAGTLFGIIGMNLLNERLNLPDLMEEEFINMARTPLGFLSMAIIVPVVEELVFRQAFLGQLLRSGMKPARAVVTSALAFALLHLNPAQMPFAFAIGLILALIWLRTGSILLTSCIHITNNSLAVIEMNLVSEPSTFRHTDLLGTMGSTLCILFCAMACIALLWRFQKTTRPLPRFEKISATI